MPVEKLRRSTRGDGPIQQSLSELSGALDGRVPAPRQQPRARKRRAPLPPQPLVDEDARSGADDDESPRRAPPPPPRAQTAGQSETDAEAAQGAFAALRALLCKRGSDDPCDNYYPIRINAR